MAFVSVARFDRVAYERDDAVRNRVGRVKDHMVDLALNVGLNPENNVTVTLGRKSIKVGISAEMDQFLRGR